MNLLEVIALGYLFGENLLLDIIGAGFLLVFIITIMILIIMLVILYNLLVEVKKMREILEKVE